VVSVALDSRGAETAGEWIRAAQPDHPSLIDQTYRLATLYNIVNVPTSVWIDESGRIVRWGEVAFVDNRYQEYTRSDMVPFLAGLRDWVARGARSPFALAPAQVRQRLALPTAEHALAAAHFRMGLHLHAEGFPEDAVASFKEAQRLRPESWCYKRQAWQLTDAERYYGTNFRAEVGKLGDRPYYPPLDLPSIE
jgi:hypothetical protein